MSTRMKLLVDVKSLQEPGFVHRAGTMGIVVEPLGHEGKVWLIEVRVPDDSLEGAAWYETLEVYSYEFEVLPDESGPTG